MSCRNRQKQTVAGAVVFCSSRGYVFLAITRWPSLEHVRPELTLGRRNYFLKIEGSYTFNASRDRVWQVLLDPKIMAQCMPGCESMNEVGPDQFEAVMKVGVASVKGTYKGKVSIKDKQAPSHYVLSGQGAGGPGFMQGDVAIDLEERNGQTVLKYSTDAKVGGLIASVGQRMLNGVAKMMVDQFFKKIESFI
jgi:uncharacterized protein